jgi:positive regulator of sigma E activity
MSSIKDIMNSPRNITAFIVLIMGLLGILLVAFSKMDFYVKIGSGFVIYIIAAIIFMSVGDFKKRQNSKPTKNSYILGRWANGSVVFLYILLPSNIFCLVLYLLHFDF